MQNGKAVRVNYTVPVNFTLSDGVVPTNSYRNFTVVNASGDRIYEAVQKEPEFPGGTAAFNRFLSTTVKYPAVDRDNNVTGKVFVQFVVEKDGSITGVKAVRGPSETTMAESVRAITLSPRWKPGMQDGKPVRVSYTVPVNFTLTNDKEELTKVSSESLEVKWMKANTFYNNSGLPVLIYVNGKDFTGSLNAINPDAIRFIDILKGESAIKKYGEKAKNGVIEITTK